MAKVLDINELTHPDNLAVEISRKYLLWETLRQKKIADWSELQRYLFAVSTTDTANSSLPWSNKTTTPKLCQIRDNLHANYMAALFPRRKWLVWEGAEESEETREKKETIENYMNWVIDRNEFYSEVSKLVLDYIDYGNVFVAPTWFSHGNSEGKYGYAGPVPRRISPTDIVFDPTAVTFSQAPKIIRSIVTLGEAKKMIVDKQFATPEEEADANKIFDYMMEKRNSISSYTGKLTVKDDIYSVAGFTSYRHYMMSGNVEVLTFYGDLYDGETFYENKIITIVDRTQVISIEDNPSYLGTAPIFHAGWRVRPDILWAMGPLDNLVGMQYRIDHLENMKADVFDTIAYPPLKVKGHVMDFKWAPMERIYVGDEGDVTMLAPDTAALQADNQIAMLEQKMEEMAGSPKEAMGFRTPGEKTAFEVQRLEAAAGRIFQNKVAAFERDILEPLINAMLELARRYMVAQTVRIFDSEAKIAIFRDLTPSDLVGSGRLKPVAARHFAERALMVQNLNQFLASPAGRDPSVLVHFSGLELAHMWEYLLELDCYNIVNPYVRVVESADQQRMVNSVQQQVAAEARTPTGMYGTDSDFGPNDDSNIQDSNLSPVDEGEGGEGVQGLRANSPPPQGRPGSSSIA